MGKLSLLFSGSLLVLGVGGGIAYWITTPGTIAYALYHDEGRSIISGQESEPYVGAWNDLVLLYRKSNDDSRSVSEVSKELKAACDSHLSKYFQGKDSLDYLFAEKWCSLKKTYLDLIEENKYELVDDWGTSRNLYNHIQGRNEGYRNFEFLNNSYRIDPVKIKRFCRMIPAHFYIEGSKTHDLFMHLCVKNARSNNTIVSNSTSKSQITKSSEEKPLPWSPMDIINLMGGKLDLNKFKNVCNGYFDQKTRRKQSENASQSVNWLCPRNISKNL